ncbi:MAG: hypothetical protein ACOC00_07290 [Halothiobacillaceae bacterium]
MSMKQARWLVATLIIIGLLGYLHGRNPMNLGKPDQPAFGPVTEVAAPDDCSVKGEGCRIELPELGTYVVRMPERVVPLEKFTLVIEPDTGLAPETGAAHANFDMIGMDMGFNDYVLQREASGRFVAEVILPVCTADRSDWILDLHLTTTRGTFFTRLPFDMPRR